MIFTIVTILVILIALVFVHELGHFLAAKISGIRVDELALGFPPRIFQKTIGETTYSIGCVPLGGFVKIFGEDGEPVPRSFKATSRLIQIFILIAGIIGNVIFAWILFSIALTSGLTVSSSDAPAQFISNNRVTVTDILPHSPAAEAGITADQTIVSLNSNPIDTIDEIKAAMAESNGLPITLVLKNPDNTIQNITLTPEKGIVSGENYAIGIAMDEIGEVHMPFLLALYDGGRLTKNTIEGIVIGFGQIIVDLFHGQNDLGVVTGPIGIARLVSQAEKVGFAYLLSFTAFISLNLAIINLVPFPALDGGRVLFVVIEAIRRKDISAKITNIINTFGFGALICLMLFLTIKDIINIF